MPVNIIRSLGLQRGKNDRVDAYRIALYAYKNRDDIKLWKPQRDIILQLRDLLALRERLITSQKALTNPIEELIAMGAKSAASRVRKNCQKTLSSIEKEIQQIDQELDDTIKGDPQLKELFQLATSVPSVFKILRKFHILYNISYPLIERLFSLIKLSC